MPGTLFQLDHFSAQIEGHKVLRDIECAVTEGEWVGLTGRSGAGKSLLGKCIAGLAPATLHSSGNILFKKNEVQPRLGQSDLRRTALSYMPQDPSASFNPVQRVGVQIEEVYKRVTGLKASSARSETYRMIEQMEFEDPERIFRSYPHELSGGQAQRSLLCMLAAKRPSLLILDEPTTDLDLITEHRVLQLVRQLTGELNAGLLFITHDISILEEFCSRILVLSEGSLVEEWTVGEEQVDREASDPSGAGLELRNAARSLKQKSTSPPSSHSPSDSDSVLRCMELSKTYALKRHFLDFTPQRIEAVDHFSYNFQFGHLYGVLGKSGSGKSTLASLLSGMTAPTNGSFEWKRLPMKPLRYRSRIHRRGGVQMIHQNPFRSFDPTKTILFSLKEAGSEFSLDEQRFHELRKQCAVEVDWLHRYPHALSGGQLQRIAVMRALLMEPTLLIADESTSALDIMNQVQLMELFKNLIRDNTMSVVFFSHQIELLLAFSDELLVLEEGRLTETAPPDQLLSRSKHDFFRAYRDLILN